MMKKCQMPACNNKAKLLKIESKIQNGINLNKVIFHFCDCHKDEELKAFMSKKCQDKVSKEQVVNPFIDIKDLLK